ncbi:MAG: hypothetical protein H6843_00300 [Rhodospirillaceae bacterium]|nr:hypothetical protein [Rhodospirillaceae bacterium]
MLQSRVEQLQQDYPLTYAILCNASGRAQVRGDAELAAPLVENIPLRMSLGFVRCSIWTSRADCEHVLDAVADIYDSVQELEDWAHDRNCPPPSLVWGEEC